ncbi:MAG: cytochrome c family protein [Pseudomonadota bacterium]
MTAVRQQNQQTGLVTLSAALLLLAACGNKSPDSESNDVSPGLTAATLGEQQVSATADYLAQEPYASANREQGARQAQICRACHSLEKDGPNLIGPALHGFFGRRAGKVEGYAYSPVLMNAGFVWTPRAMDAWLAEPHQFLPGNRMTFVGIPGQADRDALIAYLLEATSSE